MYHEDVEPLPLSPQPSQIQQQAIAAAAVEGNANKQATATMPWVQSPARDFATAKRVIPRSGRGRQVLKS